ncbi:MAG: DUF3343 domain-containing protein [Clostridia bacterium]|nr:DUF3343 domain-containing protein [Clostridia bacterium]
MRYTIVMFTSRTDTMRFYSLIKRFDGFCSLINTPHSLARSCGISIKISGTLINIAQQLIASNNFSSFKGIFEINIVNNRDIPTRIY